MLVISQVPKPSRKEIALYYKTHRSQFQIPEQLHVLHIVKHLDETADRETAAAAMQEALAELKNGMPFSHVADKYSDCAGNGGDLGWIERGIMVEEFEDVVFNLPLGEISSIFETRFGLHIAVVTEKRGPGILPMSAVYDQIAEFLTSRRAARAGSA